jgi:hypothetical protein
MTVKAIKDAIARLPGEERASLAAWLTRQTMDAWDKQMLRDFSSGGKGAKFLDQVKKEVAQGKANGTVRPLDEGLAERRRRRL